MTDTLCLLFGAQAVAKTGKSVNSPERFPVAAGFSRKGYGGLALLLLLGFSLSAAAAEKVRLQLKWQHQFQFAGYYAAQAQGYYRAAGLEVELIPSNPGDNPAQQVLQGRAEFGVGATDLLLLREKGMPVVVLASIFQHSPLAFMTLKKKELQTIHDLAGSRVMLEPESAELLAYLRREGINVGKFTLVPHSFDIRDLLSGKIEASSIYVTNEPFLVGQAGRDYLLYSPRAAGIDFYSDNLFTSEALIKANPAQVKKFREASLKGWDYAMRHQEELVQLIYNRYSQRHSLENLRFEARQMEPLLQASLVEIGHMNPGRWRHIAETYAELGMMKPNFDLKGFLYDPNPPPPDLKWWYRFMGAAILVTALVLALASYIYRINARLRREVAERRRTESYREMARDVLQILNEPGELQDSIQRVLAILKERTGVDAAGLRLQNGEDFPYFAQQGFSQDFVLTENTLVARTADGGICRDKGGKVSLECTCGLVLSGKTDRPHPLFTCGGSFWTNDSFPLLDLPSDQDPRLHPRNQCIHRGYASVALVPIRNKDRIVGLIHLNARRKGGFTLEEVELLEGIASLLGAALMRRQAEDLLQKSEQKFRLLFESLNSGFALHRIIRDKAGTPCDYQFLLVNTAFETLTGLKADEVVGRTVLQVLPHTEPVWIERYGRVATTGESVSFEQHSRELGRHYQVIAYCPEAEHFAVIITDVTDRLRTEAELQNMQKLQSVGTLAGGIAHDFNNILMELFGNLSLAKAELAKGHPGYAALAEAEKSMTRAVRLSRQLLTFAKGGEPVRENVNLGVLVEEIARFDLSGSNVMLVYQQADALFPAEVDKGQIRQAVANLILNARQAMPDGGRLHVILENAVLPEAAIPGLRPGNYVKILVRDEGAGIAPEHLARIFEPYFTTKPTGSGVGLATAYSIIRKHGGHLGVVSEPGKGAAFTLYLPASGAPAPQRGESVRTGTEFPPLDRPVRILVMDDEEALCSVIARMLNPLGYSVAVSPGGREALAIYKQAMDAGMSFDVVVMDLTIPGGMGGKDAVKALLAVDPRARVIVSSGYADDPVMASYAEYGFKGLLVKPYTQNELKAVLEQVLKENP